MWVRPLSFLKIGSSQVLGGKLADRIDPLMNLDNTILLEHLNFDPKQFFESQFCGVCPGCVGWVLVPTLAIFVKTRMECIFGGPRNSVVPSSRGWVKIFVTVHPC